MLEFSLETKESVLAKEEKFHDEWAASVDVNSIDVITMNSAVTAPEMRYITQRLGNLKGKKLLDVGCGLGEASVYFALQGATVTSTDLSPGMLDVTKRLGKKYGVDINTHQSAAESFNFKNNETFDVIYVGNLFHHVDIEPTVARIKQHLKPGGVMVSWDPVAYNPIINVYRAIATETRTPDEHPLKMSDISTFKKHFQNVETHWFWFFTLIIFILMAVVQMKSPNKVRFWKAVVEDGEKWRWLYVPLAKLDDVVLTILPFLKPLCWNVVIVASKPK